MRALVALLLVGCSPPVANRQACYATAEARAFASAASCDRAWEDCPERETILRQLQTDQEACP